MSRAAAAAALAIVITPAAGGAMAQAHTDEPVGCVIITKQITCMRAPRTQPPRPCNGPNPSPFCGLRQEPLVSTPPTSGEPSAT
jgi:hypothetical protein